MRDDGRVAGAADLVAALAELLAQLEEVVDLAVEDADDVAGLVLDRLAAGDEVDDLQPPVAEHAPAEASTEPSSGPRWTSAAFIRSTRAASAWPEGARNPQMPHTNGQTVRSRLLSRRTTARRRLLAPLLAAPGAQAGRICDRGAAAAAGRRCRRGRRAVARARAGGCAARPARPPHALRRAHACAAAGGRWRDTPSASGARRCGCASTASSRGSSAAAAGTSTRTWPPCWPSSATPTARAPPSSRRISAEDEPRLSAERPAWLTLADGQRLLELPSTHSLGMAARAATGSLPTYVHVYFHDTDLLSRKRRVALRIALEVLAGAARSPTSRGCEKPRRASPERTFALH